MYNFNLNDNESIIFDNNHVIIEQNEERGEFGVVITEERLLIFKDLTSEGTTAVLKQTKKIKPIEAMGLIMMIPLKEITSYELKNNDTLIKTNTTMIKVIDHDLSNFL